jgi:hypothetical protein
MIKVLWQGLLLLEETNFLSQNGHRDGLFDTVMRPNRKLVLHNPEQSLFNARLAKGKGRLIGSAS